MGMYGERLGRGVTREAARKYETSVTERARRDRFGRNLLATELEEAEATIEALAEKLEAADNGES